MSRAELAEAFIHSAVGPGQQGIARPTIEGFRRIVTDRSRFADRFWMLATPGRAVRLPFDDERFRDALRELLNQPARSHNRNAGFSVVSRLATPDLRAEEASVGDDQNRSLIINAQGTLSFHAPLDVPAFNTPFRRDTALWPFALCELPASFLRLLDAIYDVAEVDDSTPIAIDVGFVGLRGWSLGPYSPDAVGYRTHTQELDKDEILWSDPIVTTRRELRHSDHRDKVARRAVTRIYREFGHEGDVLPREWNRETGLLDLSD